MEFHKKKQQEIRQAHKAAELKNLEIEKTLQENDKKIKERRNELLGKQAQADERERELHAQK